MMVNKTRQLVFSGLCVAMGIALPMAFHTIPNAGSIFLPMHLPVLLCGFLCGPVYGMACGMITPLISSFATGMPAAAVLPGMVCELAVYGLVTGLLTRLVHTASETLNVYLALIGAMLSGRVVAGLLNGFLFRAGKYSLQAWVTASFVTAVPGIVIQLIALPIIVITLKKAGVAVGREKALR